MQQKPPELSWKQLGYLWLTVIVLFAFLWYGRGCNAPPPQTPEQKAEAEEWRKGMIERDEKRRAELEHPLVKAAFDAGYAFGVEHKSTGLTKLTERELDTYALAACHHLKVPKSVQGTAVRKFKSGYGWGWFNGK